jgi:organic hydroperoxide reductase OsmC/OhrA
MQDFPHQYKVAANADPDSKVVLSSDGLDDLDSAAPAEFGGPGDQWSPETLLTAAVADCFILGFKAIARASRFSWNSLQCDVEGKLERIDHVTRFTEFHIRASLEIPADADEERAKLLLDKAEATCLVTNSLTSALHLDTSISKST